MRSCTRLATVQMHASRYCNLSCSHCYSASGPEWRAARPPGLLIDALGAAHAQGYRRLTFSGGEPLLYHGLEEVLDAARKLNMLTSLTTNGIPMLASRLAALAPRLDLIAVSLDGAPERHDALRGPGAFGLMAARLPALRASGIPFGFLFTLSEASLHDLAWVAEFALEQGAALLQIHPLEQTGRAAAGPSPDDLIANAAYLAYLRLDALIGEHGDATARRAAAGPRPRLVAGGAARHPCGPMGGRRRSRLPGALPAGPRSQPGRSAGAARLQLV